MVRFFYRRLNLFKWAKLWPMFILACLIHLLLFFKIQALGFHNIHDAKHTIYGVFRIIACSNKGLISWTSIFFQLMNLTKGMQV